MAIRVIFDWPAEKIRQKQRLFLIGQQKNSWQAAGSTWISNRSGKKNGLMSHVSLRARNMLNLFKNNG
jgi:hypothetical protein